MFRGWVLTSLWALVSAAILFNAYASHRNFRESITAIFNEEQVLNVHLLQRMILDHVDEATQSLNHAIAMLRREGAAAPQFGHTIGMVYRDHTDDFLSVSVVSPLGELLYHSRGESGTNPMSVAVVDGVSLEVSDGVSVSERVYSPDGEPSTFLIVPFQISEGAETYYLFGELRLKTFLSAGMRGFQGENISFVVADDRGDIYYIANLAHQKKALMEHGDMFPLETECLECHGREDFADLARAVEKDGPVYAVFQSPAGRLVNRTSDVFSLLNEKWLVGISVPYDTLQGQIDRNFNRNAGSALLLLLLAGSGSILLYVNSRQRALEEQYYNIVDSIDIGLCRIDGGGRILSANPAMKRLVGKDVDPRREGGSFFDHCFDTDRLRGCMERLKGDGAALDCELEMKRSGGPNFQALVSAKRTAGSHIDLVVSDISARKAAETRLVQAKETLEIQNEELKKVDRVKDALISDVSHELKTPVAKQIMNLDILRHIHQRAGVSEKAADVMEAMETNIRRQQNVIKNILMTSRLESGGRKFRLDAVRLDRLVEGVISEHMHSLAAHGIHLDQDLAEVVVEADEEMLWHVLSNVLDNAIKYRRKDAPRIAVSMEKRGTDIILRVSDNGVGLSEEEMSMAFERFFQSSSSTEGIGLGLYICRTMLERMGGAIELQSAGRDRGTTAEIRLPLG